MSKFTVKSTKPAAPKAARTKPAAAAREATGADNVDAQRAYTERIMQANDEYLASQHVPTAKRLMVAAVSRLLSFSGALYFGLELVGVLMGATLVFTGSGFLAFCIGLTALILTVQAAWRVGTAVGEFIINFEPSTPAQIGRDLRVSAAKKISLVKGWFTPKRDEAEPVAA